MTEQYSEAKSRDVTPGMGAKLVLLETGSSVVTAADTVTVNIGSLGMTQVKGILEFNHISYNSAIKSMDDANKAVSSVSSGVLTITLGTGTTNRVFLVLGE